MESVILFRKSLAEENEFECAKKYFKVVEARTDVKQNQSVIGRYSVLPYYFELEQDIKNMGAQLINSHLQHQMVQDIQNWYPYLSDFTPKTWFRLEDVPTDAAEPFFLKGNINSKKQLFKTHSYAANRKEMMDVYFRLMDDSLISHQGVCIREFVNLKKYGINDITGCPIAKEFRLFLYKGNIFSSGYYWSGCDDNIQTPSPDEIDGGLLINIIKTIGLKANFMCADVAQKENGEWIVIECGDAQMAGLSCIHPDEFYKNLSEIIKSVEK